MSFWRGRGPKYRNVRRAATATDAGSEYNGRVFDSKGEARYAALLDLQVKAGTIISWIPQVSLPLPNTSGKRMVVDFLLVMPDGTVRWEDYKGAPPTRAWDLKRDLVQTAYGIEIHVVRTKW